MSRTLSSLYARQPKTQLALVFRSLHLQSSIQQIEACFFSYLLNYPSFMTIKIVELYSLSEITLDPNICMGRMDTLKLKAAFTSAGLVTTDQN